MKEQDILINLVLAEWNPICVPERLSMIEYIDYVPIIKRNLNNHQTIINCLDDILVNKMGLAYDRFNHLHRNELKEIAFKLLSINNNLRIEDLTDKDLFLLKKVKEANNKEIPIAETDIPVLYDELFIDYSTNSNLECLKRAIFIQWYSVSEPIENTGIGELNNVCQRNNLEKLKELILNKTIDNEFLEMLNHYYNISDWYFDSILNIHQLLDLTSNSKSHIIMTEERGVMGRYWESILKL